MKNLQRVRTRRQLLRATAVSAASVPFLALFRNSALAAPPPPGGGSGPPPGGGSGPPPRQEEVLDHRQEEVPAY